MRFTPGIVYILHFNHNVKEFSSCNIFEVKNFLVLLCLYQNLLYAIKMKHFNGTVTHKMRFNCSTKGTW